MDGIQARISPALYHATLHTQARQAHRHDQMGRKDKAKAKELAPNKKAQQIFNDDEEDSDGGGEEAGGSNKVCRCVCV